jgi:hypothetical protein
MSDEDHDLCEGCGSDMTYFVDGTPYTTATMVEIPEIYDGALFCAHHPNTGGCGFAWDRWERAAMSAKSYRGLHEKALPFIHQYNRRYYDADPLRAQRHGHTRP